MTNERSLLHFAGAALIASAALLGTLGCEGERSAPEEGTTATARSALAKKTYVAVRAVGQHTCGLLVDGSMNCFGENYGGDAYSMFGTFSDVSLGESANCAVRKADKTLVCWGQTYELGGLPSKTFKSISVQGRYACGILEDGSMTCFGTDSGNNETVPQTGTFKSIGVGYHHACAITTAGDPVCWGNPDYGQTLPFAVAGDSYERVVSTYGASCGLTALGVIHCWGLGTNGLPETATAPTTFLDFAANGNNTMCALDKEGAATCWGGITTTPPTKGFTSIAVGMGYACAVTATGSIECWGNSVDGSVEVSGPILQVSERGHSTCMLQTDKTLRCWGDDPYLNEAPIDAFKAVSLGDNFACALYDSNGAIHCWGDSSNGQGDWPVTGSFTKIDAEGYSACALASDKTISCWGDGGTLASPPGNSFVALGKGYNQACAIDTAGALTCWGNGNLGSSAPPSGQFTSVDVGYGTACAVAKDKSLVCWGDNPETKPGPYVAVSAREYTFCAIGEDGKVSCWEHGEGTWEFDGAPGKFQSIDTTCGVRVDGELACWGDKARNYTVIGAGVSPSSFDLIRFQSVNQELTVTGGTAPYTFQASSLSMPPGVLLTPAGVLKGSPSSYGQYGAYVGVTDANGYKGEVHLSFMVSGGMYAVAYDSGNNQSAYVGDQFEKPLVVSVSGEASTFDGVPVTFIGPNLTFDPPSVTTDANGKASVKVTATGSAGLRKVWATVGGVGTPVVFNLTANAYDSVVGIETSATNVRQGERITVSAIVDSEGEATGTAYFYVGDEIYCIKSLASEAASCSLLMKADGEHQLSVKYLGDGRNAAAVSESVAVTVTHDPNYEPPQDNVGGAGGADNGSGGTTSSSGGSQTGGASGNEAGATSEDGGTSEDSSESSGCSVSATGAASGQAWALMVGGLAMAGAVRRRRAVLGVGK
jgi:MYXO-CTERM domain-containing protein